MKLGLDCSTTTCGWAFVDNGEIQEAGFTDISKFELNRDKAFHIVQELKHHPLMEDVECINLEAALSGFMGGRTSQQVIIKLARFNAVLEYVLEEEFGFPITLVNVGTIRKKVFGKARQKGLDGKSFVKQELAKIITLPTKWDKTNKIGNPDKRNEDMYDAIVTALF